MQRPVLFLIALAASLFACVKEPDRVSLPTVRGAPYQTLVTFYADDGGSAWRPFKLGTKISQPPYTRQHVLVAEQCEDVSVVQTPDAIHVFYGEIVLRSFGSSTFYDDEPRTFLCDLHLPSCQTARDALIKNGRKAIKICPSRTPDGQPGP